MSAINDAAIAALLARLLHTAGPVSVRPSSSGRFVHYGARDISFVSRPSGMDLHRQDAGMAFSTTYRLLPDFEDGHECQLFVLGAPSTSIDTEDGAVGVIVSGTNRQRRGYDNRDGEFSGSALVCATSDYDWMLADTLRDAADEARTDATALLKDCLDDLLRLPGGADNVATALRAILPTQREGQNVVEAILRDRDLHRGVGIDDDAFAKLIIG